MGEEIQIGKNAGEVSQDLKKYPEDFLETIVFESAKEIFEGNDPPEPGPEKNNK
jgi:hypothetical protein